MRRKWWLGMGALFLWGQTLWGQGLDASAQPEVLREVGVEQRLDEEVPLGLPFRDEEGRSVTLADYFGKQPVILALVYYRCPMLCSLILGGLIRSLKGVSLESGRDYEVVAVSIDPREDPALARRKKNELLGSGAPGWHFLTGTQEAIGKLAEAVGFRYRYDAERDQYVHASAVMVATPQGRLARYFYGVEYPPRDLRLGLVEASAGRIGGVVDQVLLLCYHYDPATGKYGLIIANTLRVAGLATVLALGGLLFVLLRRERKSQRLGSGPEAGRSFKKVDG